ncbi:MAG: D-tyrosyl-tRNA(Tyr) deacylase [candidate division Zixibacteria bacterium]|nr:D-tyrosyl-tRNA(Tyr) deacylase [candidate division Zixibacteria bacterium]
MRVVLQRASDVEVWIDGAVFSSTGKGLLLLYGTATGDTEDACQFLADKIVKMRIFEDDNGKMNRSVLDVDGEIMIVSQFTLCADTSKGRRPSFNSAMAPRVAESLYLQFVDMVKKSGLTVKTGSFGAQMDIKLTNNGPVTFVLENG